MQASAGTGKSFLLETLHLWCFLHGHSAQGAAPTGIAAARVHVPRTPVEAYTLHYLFGLKPRGGSKVDPTRPESEQTKRLARMTALLMDEVSMVEDETWRASGR